MTRGENCDDDSCTTTIVIEKAMPAVVITDPAIALRTARAPSGPA